MKELLKRHANAIHNVINAAMVAVPALEVMDWTPFFSDATAAKVVGGLALAKISLNVLRDGFKGLTGYQPPVERR